MMTMLMLVMIKGELMMFVLLLMCESHVDGCREKMVASLMTRWW